MQFWPGVFAFWMLFFTEIGQAWLQQPWMHVKLAFVLLLYLYHLKCHQIFKNLQKNEVKQSSNFFRIWNEGATIILFAVVFLVILKNAINWIYGVIGIFVFSIVIMMGFKFYKKIREKKIRQLIQLSVASFLRKQVFISMKKSFLWLLFLAQQKHCFFTKKPSTTIWAKPILWIEFST